MNVLVLGGDGYLGWPIALRFAELGHKVTIMDSLVKRKWEMECGAIPLFDILPIHRRVSAFREVTGREVEFVIGDITNVGAIYHVFDLVRPDIVVQSAGQPSAPFSMKSRGNAVLTQENTYLSMINILFAIQRAEHPVHLIAINSYRCEGANVEGGIDSSQSDAHLRHNSAMSGSGSFQQLAEVGSSNAMLFACENWGLTISEVSAGVVYGFETREVARSFLLRPSFYYDAVWGTVGNRFGVQAALGYPLTVYGTGRQRRAIIALHDLIRDVELAIASPPNPGQRSLAHGVAEIVDISELAQRIQACAREAGLVTKMEPVPNPRIESEADVHANEPDTLTHLGQTYSRIEDVYDSDYFMTILKEKDRVDLTLMENTIPWKKH